MPGDQPCRGDIYHVAFEPPIGSHFAVVITSDAINRYSTSVVLAIISSKHMDTIYPHEFKVPKGLLKEPCKVKCAGLMMWPKEELNRSNYITMIPKRDMQGLDIALMKALDLWH